VFRWIASGFVSAHVGRGAHRARREIEIVGGRAARIAVIDEW